MRLLTAITVSIGLAWLSSPVGAASTGLAQDGLIDAGLVVPASCCDSLTYDNRDGHWPASAHSPPCGAAAASGCPPAAAELTWLDSVRVGYDRGFVIASRRDLDLNAGRLPFRLRINGWGQLRHTITDYSPPGRDLNQFQLKRGRLVFSGNAFDPDLSYFVQLDGRSSSGDDMRLLDYYLSFDVGHKCWQLAPGTIGFRAGKYKMPFTMARWMSGREFEFADRSMASTFFDVNRSFAWGLYGETSRFAFPVVWETALFNGLVTGGAETGSSGSLDDNFAYSLRVHGTPLGDWGTGELADFQWHQSPAMRIGFGIAASEIDRSGSTEFTSLRVVDSGSTLASLLPADVSGYSVALYSVDASWKYRGLSATLEYYFRTVHDFQGPTSVPDLFDHGMWFQLGYFVVPRKLQLLARWSRVDGNSGTLGVNDQSAAELAGGLAWYFRDQHAKLVADITHLDGAPINSSSLDINPGDNGWLYRSQIQFSF